MFRVHFPDGLYRALPFIYGVSGGVVIMALPGGWGLFSGAMLLLAALAIVQMRWAYRRAARLAREGAAARRSEAQPVDTHAGLVQLVWRPGYACGEPTLDAQHEHLFELGNNLLNAIVTRQPRSEVEFFLEALRGDVAEHFHTEEEILARASMPLNKEHRQLHARLLTQADALIERYHRGEVEAGELFGFVAYDMVARHMAQDDRMAFSRLAKN